MRPAKLRQTYTAIKRKDRSAREAWLRETAPINQADPLGFTLLHYATEEGNLDTTEFLIAQRADVNAATAYGYTPLHYAARHEDTALTQRLLTSGGDPDAEITKGRLRGWKPLHVAYAYEHVEVAALLASRTRDPTDITVKPRQHAIQGPYEIVLAYDSWPHPEQIEPTRRRCPQCGEKAIYRVGYTAEGSGVHADRFELHQCGNCRAKFWETAFRGHMRPWKTLGRYLNPWHPKDPHPEDFGS
jgi:predicted RNA-binding Zn-ribbon protein involved in translation (DUF1610 family)